MTTQERTLEKHKLVIDTWFTNGWNQVRAYMTHYPDSKYMSAAAAFGRIIKNDKIKLYIEQKHEEARMALDDSVNSIRRELINWIYSDPTCTIGLTPEEVKGLPPEIRRLVTGIKHTKREILDRSTKEVIQIVETVELKFVSKERAMDMLNRHKGHYLADNTQQYPDLTIEEKKARVQELLLMAKQEGVNLSVD